MHIPDGLNELLRQTRSVTVLTGAGVSAESGVPTFRDALTGLWEKFRPEELATPRAFRANPKLVWEWYVWRRKLVANAQPNAAHRTLADMADHFPSFTLITQNVDGLHQRAGSRDVVELHGNLARTKCFNEGVVVENWVASDEVPPRCPRCGGWLRPDVVWFEETLPEDALRRATEAASTCHVFLSIGTSSMVYPAADLPFQALAAGATVVEINPTPTPLSGEAQFSLRGRAGEVLPALWRAVRANSNSAVQDRLNPPA